MISPDRPHVPYPAVFLVGAVLGFPLVAASVALVAPALARLQYHSWPALVANHLMAMGWGTMVAMGALYQLFPAAAGVRRDPRRSDAVAGIVYVAGVVTLAAGFWSRSVSLIITGGAALVVVILAVEAMAWRVILMRRRWSWPLTYVTTALVALIAVTGWGLTMAANWRWRFWPPLFGAPGVGVHIPVGLIGWFGLLVIGVSYYLLPRFADRDAPPSRHQATVYSFLVIAVMAFLAGAAGRPSAYPLGAAMLGTGLSVYAADVWQFVFAWRRAPDITRTHWQIIAGETMLLGLGLWAFAVGWLPGDPRRWLAAAITLFLLGWLTLAIMGQVYKVTPFLMWYYRFSRRIPAYDVPRLPAPYWPAPGPWALAATALGGLMISGAILAGSVVLAQIGGVLYLIGGLIFSITIGYSWLPALRRPHS